MGRTLPERGRLPDDFVQLGFRFEPGIEEQWCDHDFEMVNQSAEFL
jgi:hypothetical protein